MENEETYLCRERQRHGAVVEMDAPLQQLLVSRHHGRPSDRQPSSCPRPVPLLSPHLHPILLHLFLSVSNLCNLS
jgi:hypothetical protein